MINFIKAMLNFQDIAARDSLSGNEVLLFLALFREMNDRRWPEGMVEISNNQLLARTTFGGSHRDDTLRAARQHLADRGLIRFIPGDRRSRQPQYAINWEALGIRAEAAPETATDIAPQKAGQKAGQTPVYNNISVFPGTVNEKGNENRAAAHTYRAREEGYMGLDGQEHPARYDGAWMVSDRARCAVAGRLINRMAAAGCRLDSSHLLDRMAELLGYGMPPEIMEDLIDQRRGQPASAVLARLQTHAAMHGYTLQAAERRAAEAAREASPLLARVLAWRQRVQREAAEQ